jgi:hypothetical protein
MDTVKGSAARRKRKSKPLALRFRLVLSCSALLLLIYVVLIIHIGAIYFSFARSAVFITGIPLLLIVMSLSSLAFAASLKVANREVSLYLKAALVLMIVGLAWSFVEGVLGILGASVDQVDIGPASPYRLYSPGLSSTYGPYLAPVLKNTGPIAVASIGIGILGMVLSKVQQATSKRMAEVALGVALLGGVALGLAHTVDELLLGELTIEIQRKEVVIDAEDEASKFNAVLLTHFSLCGLGGLLAISTFAAAFPRKSKSRKSKRHT